MILTKTIFLLLVFQLSACGTQSKDEIFVKKDRPYSVINITIPKDIWRQAFKPTPVLKSQMTIVVPVHVPQDENEVDEYYDEVVEENPVANVTEPLNDEAVPVQDETGGSATTVATVSQSPVVEDEPTAPPADTVAGEVTRFPCQCRSGRCSCCTGTILQRINMKACGDIQFVPEDFVFDVRLSVNNRTMIRRRVSASDPPPICFNPGRAPFVDVCAEISNIRIRNSNAYACLDLNADIGGFPIYSVSFRCFGLGASGVQTGLKPKPVSSGPKPVSLFGSNKDEEEESGGGFFQNAAGAILGGSQSGGLFGDSESEGGLFGGGSDESDDDDDGGPLDGIGDAIGDFFGRNNRE